MQNLTAEERETIIRYSYADDKAIIFTYDRALRNKLNKLAEENADIKIVKDGDDWMEYEVDKKWIKVSPPRKVNMTDKQRKEAAERLAKSRLNKQYG